MSVFQIAPRYWPSPVRENEDALDRYVEAVTEELRRHGFATRFMEADYEPHPGEGPQGVQVDTLIAFNEGTPAMDAARSIMWWRDDRPLTAPSTA